MTQLVDLQDVLVQMVVQVVDHQKIKRFHLHQLNKLFLVGLQKEVREVYLLITELVVELHLEQKLAAVEVAQEV